MKMNITFARKCLGAIPYRLDDKYLSERQRFALCYRHLGEFADTIDDKLLDKVSAVLSATKHAIDEHDFKEVRAGVKLLQLLMPEYTYGEIVAGSSFRLAKGGAVYTKRKGGVDRENPVCCRLIEHCAHLPAGTIVYPLEDCL